MLSRFIAISIATLGLATAAQATESSKFNYQLRSINYVGFDGIDSAGQPICKKCEVAKQAERDAEAAIVERRQRAREFMARLQGQKTPVTVEPQTSVAAVDISPTATSTEQSLSAAKVGVAETPLRASLQ